MNALLAGSSVLGGFVGGVVALLAPCCVTVLLPAYFAAAFTSVRTLVRMTFLFGAGIALPYVVGMVFPLCGLALAGDRFGWPRSRAVRGTTVRLRFRGREHAVHSTNLVGGLFFLAMGVFVLVLAVTGNEFLTLPGQT